jgi:DNA-binding NarL/FixJ family response regulator
MSAPAQAELNGDLGGAAAQWAERSMPRHQALVLMQMDPTRHPSALAEAIQIFDRMGAVACGDAARRLAHRQVTAGVKGIRTGPRSAARSNRFGLTARELQIARLLGQGLSNQAIAERLSRSPRTVEHHVSTVLSKLGARARTEVAGLLGSD